MFVIYYIRKRENIATPSGYIFVFANEVFNKNYCKISVTATSTSAVELLDTQIFP